MLKLATPHRVAWTEMAHQRLTAVGLKVGEILALHLSGDTDLWIVEWMIRLMERPVDGQPWWTEHRISLTESIVVATTAERDFTIVTHVSERAWEWRDATP